jgi:hypothetical protein
VLPLDLSKPRAGEPATKLFAEIDKLFSDSRSLQSAYSAAMESSTLSSLLGDLSLTVLPDLDALPSKTTTIAIGGHAGDISGAEPNDIIMRVPTIALLESGLPSNGTAPGLLQKLINYQSQADQEAWALHCHSEELSNFDKRQMKGRDHAARHATDVRYDHTIIINTLDFKIPMATWATAVAEFLEQKVANGLCAKIYFVTAIDDQCSPGSAHLATSGSSGPTPAHGSAMCGALPQRTRSF